MVREHHQLNGHEFEQTPRYGEGQGSVACCSPWGHKGLDRTSWLNNSNPLNDSSLSPSTPALGRHRSILSVRWQFQWPHVSLVIFVCPFVTCLIHLCVRVCSYCSLGQSSFLSLYNIPFSNGIFACFCLFLSLLRYSWHTTCISLRCTT